MSPICPIPRHGLQRLSLRPLLRSTGPIENEDDDADSLPDEASGLLAGKLYPQRSRDREPRTVNCEPCL